MKFELIDDWRIELRRLWSVRVAAFWSLVWGLILVWPGLTGAIPLWLYVVGGLVTCVSFGVARVLKQPGTDVP